MLTNKNPSSFQMRKISPFKSATKSKTLPTCQRPIETDRNSNPNIIYKAKLLSKEWQRSSEILKTQPRGILTHQITQNESHQGKTKAMSSRMSFNKKMLPSLKTNIFFNQSNINGSPLLAKKNKFHYYISEVTRDLSKYAKSEQQSIFISHIIYGMHALKITKYISAPVQPHTKVSIPWKQLKFDRTLIFDMDQTLVHSLMEYEASYYYDQREILIQSGESQEITTMSINFRPFLLQTLENLAKYFNIGVFTAGSESYASKILNEIDPMNKIFDFKLFRNHCVLRNSNEKIKDLRIIEGIDLDKTLLIDNSPYSAIFQKDNLIPIIPFTDDEKDDQLKKLSEYLIRSFANFSGSFRDVVRKHFRIEQYEKHSTVKELIEKLYSNLI